MTGRAVSLTSFRVTWRAIEEPVALVFRGRVIGTFAPSHDAADAQTASVKHPYKPEPLEVEVAKIATEVAQALMEIEEVRDRLRPDEQIRARSVDRERLYQRRRLALANLRHAKEESQ